MRLIGPNCLGVASPRLTATFARPPDGRQRGAHLAERRHRDRRARAGAGHGIGLSAFVSIGDRGDISSNDVIQWCEEDAGTDVIALYLESFGNPRRFARIARRVTRTKPIVAVKAGRSAAGGRAAGSHTGALVAASDATVDALFAQAGVVRTDTYRELLDVAALLAAGPAPAGRRLGVVTNAGGPAILLADAAEAAGLELPAPSRGDRAARSRRARRRASNPLDVLGDAGADRLRAAVAAAAADPAFDALAIVYVPTLVLDAEAAAARSLTACRLAPPAVAVFMTGTRRPRACARPGSPSSPSPRTPRGRSAPRRAAHPRAAPARGRRRRRRRAAAARRAGDSRPQAVRSPRTLRPAAAESRLVRSPRRREAPRSSAARSR